MAALIGLIMPMLVIIMDQIEIMFPLIHIIKPDCMIPMKGFCASRIANYIKHTNKNTS